MSSISTGIFHERTAMNEVASSERLSWVRTNSQPRRMYPEPTNIEDWPVVGERLRSLLACSMSSRIVQTAMRALAHPMSSLPVQLSVHCSTKTRQTLMPLFFHSLFSSVFLVNMCATNSNLLRDPASDLASSQDSWMAILGDRGKESRTRGLYFTSSPPPPSSRR